MTIFKEISKASRNNQASIFAFILKFKLIIINCLIVVSPYSRADKLIDCELFDKSTKIGTEVVCYVTSKIRDRAIGQRRGHAHVQIWSKSKIFQKGRTDFIFEPK